MPRQQSRLAKTEQPSTVGSRIKEFAKQQFGGVAQLERKLGLSVNWLSAYLRKDKPAMPGGDLLRKIGALGADLNYILLGRPSTSESSDQVKGGMRAAKKVVKGGATETVIDVREFKMVDESLALLYPVRGEEVIVVRKASSNLRSAKSKL